MVPLYGPTGWRFLISEGPLYRSIRMDKTLWQVDRPAQTPLKKVTLKEGWIWVEPWDQIVFFYCLDLHHKSPGSGESQCTSRFCKRRFDLVQNSRPPKYLVTLCEKISRLHPRKREKKIVDDFYRDRQFFSIVSFTRSVRMEASEITKKF